MQIRFVSHSRKGIVADIFAGVLILAVMLAFWKIYVVDRLVLPSPTIYTTDMYSQFYPKFIYGNTIVSSGHIPLWEPNEYCGMPFLATLQAGVFYPFKFIMFLFFTPSTAIRVFVALHIFMTGIWTYVFFRVIQLSKTAAFAGSLICAFSTPLAFECVFAPARLASISWFPFSLTCLHMLLTKRKLMWSLMLAAGLTLQFFAGYPPTFLSGVTLLGVYYVFQTWVFRAKTPRHDLYRTHLLLIFSAVLFFGLAAVQFLPFYEFLGQSQRATGITTIWQLPREFLFPLSRLFLSSEGIQQRRTPLFMGCVSFLLLLYGLILSKKPVKLFLAAAGIFTIVMSLGDATPVSPLLHRFPPFKYDRYPIMWYYHYFFFVAGLVALGIDYLKHECALSGNLTKARKLMFWRRDIAAPLILLGFIAVFGFLGLQEFEIISVALTCPIVFFLIFARNKHMKELSAILLLLIIGLVYVKQIAVTDKYVQLPREGVKELSVLTSNPEVADLLKGNRFYRVYSSELLWEAKYLFSGIEMINGYEGSLVPQRMVRIIWFYGYEYKFSKEHWERFVGNPAFMDLMGTRLIFAPPNHAALFQKNTDRYELLSTNTAYGATVLNKGALPRCLLVHEADVTKNEDEVFAKLRDGKVDPSKVAILEENLPADAPLRQPRGEEGPRIVTYKPEEVLIEATPEAGALLVLHDSYYPGWKAFVDHKETRIYRANYLFRAIYLPPGKHTVIFVYAPLSYRLGAGISFVGWLIVVVFFVFSTVLFIRKRRRGTQAVPAIVES